jgi:16S rRNA (guanine527-N7)-methyltransferase
VSDHARRLSEGAAELGVALDTRQLAQFATLAAELVRWNRAINLTAITTPDEILTQHLLDSLSAHRDLVGERIADVGCGAGFPGLPLAIANTGKHFTLIDAVDKKLRFIDHVVRELQLTNVQTQHARVEQLTSVQPYDCVIARAFAPLPRLVDWVAPLCDAHTVVIAMKGRWPPADAADAAGPLPDGWRIESVRPVHVPGLHADRNIVLLRRS